MHDIRRIREQPEEFDRGLTRRGLEPLARHLISIDERRRAIIRVYESWKARLNVASKDIGQAKAKNDEAAVQKLMGEAAECKTSLSTLEAEQKAVDKELADALAEIPNLPLDDVPDGADEHSNVEHHRFGAKREYNFTPKQHFELGEALGQMDFETAAKLSGARFVVLKNGLARLERALGQFMLDAHTQEHGYTEVNPPLLVRDDVMFGTAQLPKFAEDQFGTEVFNEDAIANIAAKYAADFVKRNFSDPEEDEVREFLRQVTGSKPENAELLKGIVEEAEQHARNLAKSVQVGNRRWLIPTAEVPLTNLVRESVLDEGQLPMRLTAYTPCFRAEAGAAGKDTRGMIRQHQFSKVELVSITTPEQSADEHERMLSCAEEVLRRLDLHYRVVTLCTGDMGFAAQKTYDIDVWLPGQGAYREISSCSTCGEFQARRMQARYRPKEGRQPRHVHTLNGSGVAVGRALIAVMETYQQADGSIAVPNVLQPYMGGMKMIEPAG